MTNKINDFFAATPQVLLPKAIFGDSNYNSYYIIVRSQEDKLLMTTTQSYVGMRTIQLLA